MVSKASAPAMPDPRSRVDRRQRDGLGLLPRAKTAEERRKRERANRLLGALTLALGLIIALGSVGLLFHHPTSPTGLSGVLGLFICWQGWRRVTWKDRRRSADRRRERT